MRGLVTFAAAVAGLSLLPVNAAAQTPSALPSSLHLPKAAPATLWITPEFTPGKQIPKKFAMKECGGENASPRLTWKGAPKATKSFVVTFTDSTMDNAYHWIVADIPSTTKALPSNVEIGQNPAYGRLAKASVGKAQYYGPCPPKGSQHTYVITLFALDVPHLPIETPPDVLQMTAGHIIGEVTILARYRR